MRMYFVARPPIEYCEDIHAEILEGRLRFGWGTKGCDLRKGKENFITVCIEKGQTAKDAEREYHVLSVLKNIRIGDIILLPRVSINRPEVGSYFTVAECTAEYSFKPLSNNDFGHIVGVKLISTFDYSEVDSKINKAFRYRAINRINDPEKIRLIENLLRPLLPPENNLDSVTEKMVALQDSYLEELLKVVKTLPPNTPGQKGYSSQKILEMLRTFLPETLKKLVKDLFTKNGHRLVDENSGFTFEVFSERDILHDCYTTDTIPKIFVGVKNLGDSYENAFAQFDKANTHIRILIDFTEQFDEKITALAKERNIMLIDGLTFANILMRHKV